MATVFSHYRPLAADGSAGKARIRDAPSAHAPALPGWRKPFLFHRRPRPTSPIGACPPDGGSSPAAFRFRPGLKFGPFHKEQRFSLQIPRRNGRQHDRRYRQQRFSLQIPPYPSAGARRSPIPFRDVRRRRPAERTSGIKGKASFSFYAAGSAIPIFCTVPPKAS